MAAWMFFFSFNFYCFTKNIHYYAPPQKKRVIHSPNKKKILEIFQATDPQKSNDAKWQIAWYGNLC